MFVREEGLTDNKSTLIQMPNRQQAITWTNDDSLWHDMSPQGTMS